MRTYTPKVEEITREWHVLDAEGLILGRLSTLAATLLRGKHRTFYAPHIDTGDNVIVINADKVVVTANKLAQNKHWRHSGYPGGIRSTTWQKMFDEDPVELVTKSIRGMVPKNRLGRAQMDKLFVYKGPEHPHIAQQPKKFDTSAVRRG